MAKHKWSVEWETQVINLTMNNQRQSIHSASCKEQQTQKAETTSTTAEKATHIQTQSSQPTTNYKRTNGPGKGPHRRLAPQSHKQWIPKRLLQAQGYYEGNKLLWIPKKLSKHPNQPQQAKDAPTMATLSSP